MRFGFTRYSGISQTELHCYFNLDTRPNNSADVATQNEAQGEGISDSAVASTSVADFLRKEATSNHDFRYLDYCFIVECINTNRQT